MATGLVGGIDVATGVLALLLVKKATGSELLGGLAFSIGFVSLTLARSELFTENFLVPVIAVLAKRSPITRLLRLWGGTTVFNLIGGWLVMGLVIVGFPQLHAVAIYMRWPSRRVRPTSGSGWASGRSPSRCSAAP